MTVPDIPAEAVEAAAAQGSTQDYCHRTEEDHHWASHILGGAPIWVRICTLCQHIDWDGLQEQANDLRAAWLAEVQKALRDEERWDAWYSCHPIGAQMYGPNVMAAGYLRDTLTGEAEKGT